MSGPSAAPAARPCVAVDLPPGPEALDVLLPALRSALAGTGPAIAPLPARGSGELRERLVRALRPADPVPGSVAAVLATSGSTAEPRGVLLPGSAIASAATALARAVGRGPGGHRWVAALPLSSAGGFMVAARAVLAGVPPVGMSSLGGAQPFSIEDLAAATTGAQGRSRRDGLPLAISVVPTMLARVIEAGQDAIDVLARYDLVLVGGSATDQGVLASLRSAGVSVRASYGMTETCGGAVLDGVPLPGVGVRVDPDGRVRISGPQVALGYRGGSPSADWSTGARGVRAFRTSDVGSVEDGLVVLHGRADDIVQVGGTSVDLAAIRRVIRTDPAVADAEVVALPDAAWGAQVIAVIVPRPVLTEGAATAPRTGANSEPSTTAEAQAGPEPRITPNPNAETATGSASSTETITNGAETSTVPRQGAGTTPVGDAGPRASTAPTSSARDLAIEQPNATRRAIPPGMAERLTHAIGETLGRSARPRRIVALDAIPHLPAGKPDRLTLLRILGAPQDAPAAAGGPSVDPHWTTGKVPQGGADALGRMTP